MAVEPAKTTAKKISVFTRIRERMTYLFTFKTEKKIELLEKQAEKRLDTAKEFAKEGNNEEVKNQIQDYNDTKEKQDILLDKIENPRQSLDKVEERTIEQQKTMEEIKTNVVDKDVKNEIIQTQENVVNQVAKKVVVTDGKEGLTNFQNKVEHVWAPGTNGKGEGGVIYQGGSKMMFAPGTGAGGQSGVEVKGGNSQYAPGTGAGGGGGKVEVKNIEVKSN